jgi:hypothetical protein
MGEAPKDALDSDRSRAEPLKTKHNNRLATAILEINMGWFFGDQQDADPTKHLDPKLKEFLKKETPEEYVPALKPPEPPKSSLEKALPPGPSSNPEQTPESDNPSVPSESQFPDGRYADLWKTYVPLHQQEGAQNMDKLRQVVEAHKDRQYLLGKAALENCAEEHMVVSTCFATGGMRARMTMCKRENSQFARCYEMQSVSELPSPKNRIVDANSEPSEILKSLGLRINVQPGHPNSRAYPNARRQALPPYAGLRDLRQRGRGKRPRTTTL